MSHAKTSFISTILLMSSMAMGQTTQSDAPPTSPEVKTEASPELIQRARAQQQQEKWVEAAESYMEITEVQPDNANAWFNLGYCLHMAGELDLAINAHRKASTFEQFTGIALYNLGCAYALLDEKDEAFAALEASAKAGFDVGANMRGDSDLVNLHDDARFEAFREAASSGSGDGITSAIQRAKAYLEQNGPAMMQQAMAMAQQFAGMAQQKYQELQQKAGNKEELAAIKQRLFEMYGQAHQAFAQWQMRQNPEAYASQDESETSLESIEEDASETSDVAQVDLEALSQLANNHFQRAQWADAAQAYSAIGKIQELDGVQWYRLGYALHLDGQIEEALEAHQKAAEFDAFRGIALFNLACAHSLLNHADEAFEALEQCREAGFDRIQDMANDSDFDNIRDDERYEAFLASLQDDGV
ncbi:MAG: tetratricopeptide repeat protein [Planctomycetota bacterium]|nr:tetratricopeptide repeat protein [Planctomycetota bacterium]